MARGGVGVRGLSVSHLGFTNSLSPETGRKLFATRFAGRPRKAFRGRRRLPFARPKSYSQSSCYSLWLWGWSSPLSRSDIIRQRTITQTAAALLPPRYLHTHRTEVRDTAGWTIFFLPPPPSRTNGRLARTISRTHSHRLPLFVAHLYAKTHTVQCTRHTHTTLSAAAAAAAAAVVLLVLWPSIYFFTHRQIPCTGDQLIEERSQHWTVNTSVCRPGLPQHHRPFAALSSRPISRDIRPAVAIFFPYPRLATTVWRTEYLPAQCIFLIYEHRSCIFSTSWLRIIIHT